MTKSPGQIRRVLARRRLLAGAAAAATGGLVVATLGGCDVLLQAEPGVPPAPADPLEPLLTAELALIASYDAAIGRLPAAAARLSAIRADHAAHAQALRARLDPRRSAKVPPSADASPAITATSARATFAALATAERAAAERATAACLAAAGERAALLASISASESSHLVVLT